MPQERNILILGCKELNALNTMYVYNIYINPIRFLKIQGPNAKNASYFPLPVGEGFAP